MADVIAFPNRLRVICSEAIQQEEEAQALLNEMLLRAQIACPTCGGTGRMNYKSRATGLLVNAPCPCGGTDEDLNDFDFGGAA